MTSKRMKRYLRIQAIFVLVLILCFLLLTTSKQNSSKRTLCIVLTTERTILTRGIAVWSTWGKDCDQVLFACNCSILMKVKQLLETGQKVPDKMRVFVNASRLPLLNLKVEESKLKMGDKVMVVLVNVYERYGKEFNSFYMADDDTFVFVENLKKFTLNVNPTEANLYGFRFKHAMPGGFIGGGAGVLFTKESFKRLAEAIINRKCDRIKDRFGDITIGRCAKIADVRLGESTDEKSRQRFLPHDPHTHFHGPLPKPIYTLGTHDGKLGKECCSRETISFHYVKPNVMYSIYANKTFLRDLLS